MKQKTLDEIFEIINNELIGLDELDSWLMQDAILLGELLDPNGDTFNYEKRGNGFCTYYDSYNNKFFVKLNYVPSVEGTYMELKTGWFLNNNELYPRYEPSLPANVTSMDSNIRTNTVAKIFSKEFIPLFKSNPLTKIMIVKPISSSRYAFAIRLIKKTIPKEWTIIESHPKLITIIKP